MYGREPYRHRERRCLLVIIALTVLLDLTTVISVGPGAQSISEDHTQISPWGVYPFRTGAHSTSREGPSKLCLNEVYPDPDSDQNGDAVIDQMDEFIELYNPSAVTVNLSDHSVSDNQDLFSLGPILLGPGEMLALFRGTTGLVLSNDEVVTLRYPNGTVLDVLDYPFLRRGWTFQRSPDGSERTRTGRSPTPGAPNPVPVLVLNEVMPDPAGSNTGKQWVELLNKGKPEELKDMVLTNNEAISYILPQFEIAQGERALIALGKSDALPLYSNSTRVLEASLTETLFSSGDDLELKDRDGSSLDYLAWGSSKHIEGPKGLFSAHSWDGMIWDPISGSMSTEGLPNPPVLTNRSLSRSPDGRDTDRTMDLIPHIGLLGSSPGWENHIDPTVQYGTVPKVMTFEKGGTSLLKVQLSASCNMSGVLKVDLGLSNDNWKLGGPNGTLSQLGPGETLEVVLSPEAPKDLALGHSCTLVVKAVWTFWEFLTFCLNIDFLIPSPELYLSDLFCTFEGIPACMVPEGAIIDVGGKFCGGGEVPSSDAVLSVSIYNSSSGPYDPNIRSQSISFKDLTIFSKRNFAFTIDTFGFLEGTSILLEVDPFDSIEESDESNNGMIWEIIVFPAPSFQGQGSLRFSEVLWNTTTSGRYVRIDNIASVPAELSRFFLGSDGTEASFPTDCWLGPEGSAYVLWGVPAESRIPPGSKMFRMDGKGLVSDRMTLSSGLPDPEEAGSIRLSTRWRVPVDEVLLHVGGRGTDGCIPLFNGPVETTFGTVLKRARTMDGSLIDTNSTLDWMVEPIKAGLSALLVSPEPSGSGELMVIEGMGNDFDLSGACLVCRGRVAVLPNGTRTGKDGLISVSNDPDRFLAVQGVYPDLTTGWDLTTGTVTIPGCRVSGYEELLLPNDGAELLLLDRGNRVLDRVIYGSDGIGPILDIPYGTVIHRSFQDDGEKGTWKALCSSTETAYSLLGIESVAHDIGLNPGTDDIFHTFDNESNVKLYTPFLQEGALLDLAMGILETYCEIEVYLGCQPWEGAVSSGYQGFDVTSGLKACAAVSSSGGRIYAPGTISGSDQFTPFIVSGDRTIVLYGYGLGPEMNDVPHIPPVKLGPIDGIPSLSTLCRMTPSVEMVDITSILSSMNVPMSGPRPNDIGPFFAAPSTYFDEMNCSLRNALDTIEGGEGKEVWVLHNGGPLDMVALLDLAKNGSSVKLLINPREVRPSTPETENGMDLNVDSSFPRLDLDELERFVLEDSIRAVKLASEQGMDLDIRVLPVGSGFLHWSGIQVSSGTVQIELPSAGMGHRVALRLSGPGLSVWDEVMGMLWVGCHPLPLEMGWGAPKKVLDIPGPAVRIQEVYPDTYLVDDPDEYVALFNSGALAVDISGWTLSDDEGVGLDSDGTVMVPKGSIVKPGGMFFIARDHQCFIQQNGHRPDLSMSNCSISSMVLVCQGDMRLSNKGDSLVLRDTSGSVVDSVLYGASDPLPNGGGFYPLGCWSGGPAPLSGWGNVLHREQRTYGRPSSDTGTREDWMGLRPRGPGQSRFGPFPESEVKSISTGYCPDSGSDLLSSLIAGTGRSLDVNVYELTSEWVTTALVGAVARGVEVRITIEGSPVGGRTYGSDLRTNELLLAGAQVRYMVTDVSKGLRDRYSFNHAKYMISDGRTVLISSDNFKDSSFPPPILNGDCSGTRGWVMLLESVPLSEQLAKVFEEDWNGPDMVDGRMVVGEMTVPEGGSVPSANLRGEGLHIFRGSTVDESAKATLMISPDHISLEGNPLLQAIDRAEREVLVEALSMDIDYLVMGANASKVRAYHGIAIQGADWPNPYVTALLEAAKRGVDVKVLLDGSDFNGDSIPDNQYCAEKLLEAAGSMDLSGNFSVRLHPAERTDLERKIDLVHNKGIIIDSKMVWTSSFNIGPTSALKNREVGVLVTSEKVSGLFRSVFMFDWGGTLLGEDPVRSVHYGPVGTSRTKGVKVEVTFNEGWIPGTGSELVLLPSSEWDLDGPSKAGGSAVTTENGSAHLASLILPDLDISEPNELDLYLRSGDRWAHILRFKVEPFEPTRSYDRVPWYRNDVVPLLGSVTLAIALSALIELFLKRSINGKFPRNDRMAEE